MIEGKRAKNTEEADRIQETYEEKPHGWIQWKGTDVCMDVHCKCGQIVHVDGDFAYNVRCPYCKTIYMCNPHIELIELTEEEPEMLVTAEE